MGLHHPNSHLGTYLHKVARVKQGGTCHWNNGQLYLVFRSLSSRKSITSLINHKTWHCSLGGTQSIVYKTGLSACLKTHCIHKRA
jgi:hypothetical protein